MSTRPQSVWRRHWDLLLLAVIATIVILAFDVWSLRYTYIIAYGDAVSHLAISRRVIDNVTPGFGQLGSSWLPALHLLMLPFIWNDYLWHSGLAGAIVSNVAFIGSVLYGYRLIYFFLKNKGLSVLITLVIFANPNLLYLSTTAMNEALFVFSALASTVHMLLWTREPQRAYHLIWAGLFSFLTAFNRYEGWFFVIGQACLLLIVAWRLRGRRWALGTSLLFAHVAFAAPALWLGWNWLIFGDPLFFLHNDYTSAGSQQSLALAGLLPTKDHPLIATEYFWRAMVHILGFGPAAMTVFTFGLCSLVIPILLVLRRKKTDTVSALLVVSALTVPIFFLLFTLVQGVTALHVPDAPPFGEYNVRYALFAFPALVGFLAIMVKAGQRFSPILPWGILVLLIMGIIPVWNLPWIGLVEARGNQLSNERRAKAVNFILNQYDAGDRFLISAASEERSVTPESETKILISAGAGAGNPLMHRLGLSMSSFIHEGADEIWDQALENPENHVEWVIMTNTDPQFNRDKVYEQFMAHPELLAHYELVYKDGALEIYHLRNPIKN